MKMLIDKLRDTQALTKEEWSTLIDAGKTTDLRLNKYLHSEALKIKEAHYGKSVYIRGLIEISNICKNDCYYCGIRCSNKKSVRYRLLPEQILKCADNGYELGFRTFVLQGGEDGYYTDDILCPLIKQLKSNHPDCAVTLSLGERSRESYEKLKEAGADRYLLRHETANYEHYSRLHPENLSLKTRKQCLNNLKEIGFQTGSGFMVGSPYQTTENLAEDMIFLKELNPHMVGIGPFIPHCDTPFADHSPGSVDLTVFMISLIRLMLPKALIPATTALGTLAKDGRERGILAGANVIMPNLSPEDARRNYTLYDNKLHTGAENAAHLQELKNKIEKIGHRIVTARGDYIEN